MNFHPFNLVLVVKLKYLRLAINISYFVLAFNLEKFLFIFSIFFFNFELIKIIEKELAVLKDTVQWVHLLMGKIIKDSLLINFMTDLLLNFYYIVYFLKMDYIYFIFVFFSRFLFLLKFYIFHHFFNYGDFNY